MNATIIKKAGPADLAGLQLISRNTFSETFSSTNSAENMKQYIEEGFADEKLLAELENKASEFYFAVLNNEIIGYLKLNFGHAQTEIKDDCALEIERIYILQDYQGKKVGQLLYHKAIQVATEKGADYVWLGVWEKNEKAIGFYEKNGFITFDKHLFKLGDDIQTDLMMKKIL